MKILQMCDVRWYNANAHYVVELSRGLQAAGEEVTLWAREQTPILEKAQQAGIPVVAHKRGDLFKLWRLWWLVRRGKFEIVNTHRGSDLFLAMLLKLFCAIRVVVTRSDIRPFRNNAINRYFFAEQVDQVILSGHFHLEQGMMEPFSVPEESVTVVPLGMEMPSLAVEETVPTVMRLVMVGRFDHVKGHRTVLEAFRVLHRELPEVELLFIGYPAALTAAELRQQAANLPVSIIDHQVDISAALASCQIGIVASSGSEAVARSGLEYLSRGMPVVGTRINSIAELIQDEVNGLLVPADDPAEMTAAMLRICREYELFREGVHSTREKYSLEKMVRSTRATYRRLLP